MTREVLLQGTVTAARVVVVTAPLDGFVVGPLPDPGTEISAGDVLFELAPSLEVRLAAAELEAALLARDAGSGDTAVLAARVAAASDAALAVGLPVDERARQPLPESIAILAPEDGIIIGVFQPDAETSNGQRIVEIGHVDTLLVRAHLNDEVAGLIRIGQVVFLGVGAGQPIAAVVNRVTVDEQGRPVLDAVFGPGDVAAGEFPPGTELVLTQGDRPETAGRVRSVQVLASSLILVEVVVEGETLIFDEAIRIAPRDGSGVSIVGQVTEIAVDDDGQPFLTIDVSGSAMGLGESVTLSFAVSERHGVLWLPPDSIRSFAGSSFVIVATDGGGQERIDVEVGLVTTERVEVSGDLEEGQLVVAP